MEFILFVAVAFFVSCLAAWPSRFWYLTDLALICVMAALTANAGLGAGGMYAVMSAVFFFSYCVVGAVLAIRALRRTRSADAAIPLLARIARGIFVLVGGLAAIFLAAKMG